MNLRHPQNQNILTEMKSWLIPSPLFSPHPAPSNNCGQMYLSHTHTHTALVSSKGPGNHLITHKHFQQNFYSIQVSEVSFGSSIQERKQVSHTHRISESLESAPVPVSTNVHEKNSGLHKSEESSHGKGEMGQICEILGDVASGQKNIRRCPETLWKLCTSLRNSHPAVDHVGQCLFSLASFISPLNS